MLSRTDTKTFYPTTYDTPVIMMYNILYDTQDTRVKLNPNNNLTGNDYINANFVNVSLFTVLTSVSQEATCTVSCMEVVLCAYYKITNSI